MMTVSADAGIWIVDIYVYNYSICTYYMYSFFSLAKSHLQVFIIIIVSLTVWHLQIYQ